jgi:hypothetical protein
MSTNGLPAIRTSEQCAGTRVALDLVGHEDDEIELLSQGCQTAKMAAELRLAICEFATALIVGPEQGADGVHDEQAEATSRELLRELGEQVMLVLAVLGTGLDDVLVGNLWVDAEALRDLDDALRTECALGVCGRCCQRGFHEEMRGINAPMYATLPSPPPWLLGSWAITARVCASCVFLQRNSPNTSLMLQDWKPPAKMVSHCLLPVESRKQRFRISRSSAEVMNVVTPVFGCGKNHD